jgi:hypothetical protein
MKVRFDLTENLSVPNDVLSIADVSEVGCIIAGLPILYKKAQRNTNADNGKRICFMQSRLEHTKLFVLINYKVAQRKTRISEFKRLWSVAKTTFNTDIRGERDFLVEYTPNKTVNFFGLAKIPDNRYVFQHIWQSEIFDFFFLFVAPEEVIDSDLIILCQTGWVPTIASPPTEILRLLCRTRTLLCVHSGSYDDPEAGYVFLGARPYLAKILY